MKPNDARIIDNGALNEKLLRLSVETAEQHLATAKLTHQKITEQISMRTTTIASIAGNIFAQMLASNKPMPQEYYAAATLVKLAEDIISAAELAASKAKELQEQLV